MTPIDQLIVTLGLNTRPFVAGVSQAIRTWKSASAQFQKQTATIAASSNQAAVGIGALRLGVAGLAAVVGFVGTKELLEWNRQMIQAGSNTYRFANRIGSTVPVVNQLRGAVRIAGGTFEDADIGLAAIADALQKWQLLGQDTPAKFLRAFNVDLAKFDPNKPEEVIRLIREMTAGAAANKLKPGQVNALAGMIFPSSLIDLILLGPAKVKGILAYTKNFAASSEEAAKWARMTDEEFGRIDVVSGSIGKKIYTWFAPGTLVLVRQLKSLLEAIADYIGATSTSKGLLSNLGGTFSKLLGLPSWLANSFVTPLGESEPTFGGSSRRSSFRSNSRWRSGLGVGEGFSVGRPDIVSSATGLPIRAGQFNAGGNVNPSTVALARDIYNAMSGDIASFTAFNDPFHQGMNSLHNKGQALDFILKDPTRAAEVVRQIHQIAPNAHVLNEYEKRSPGSTGGHIHVSITVNGYSSKDANIIADTTANRLQTVLGSARGAN